ncbi:superoxide dismutase family protein [Paenibacillus qinlingensis]|uniref:Superoxide dismutase [Cu-Zn] n=1 Tax=Paenibacillus qinlingensis TaxID=1837343 RepID=A0ABU1NVE9_9BACL|nr:superoxide dismutase family protein [Paenibacillus qinlingensis]MDR6551441.1 Cu-Zn family superoxide dismutase [Paenibacillus qinlingensis]
MKSMQIMVTASLGLMLLSGCQTVRSTSVAEPTAPPETVRVTLIGADNQSVGSAQLTAVSNGVQMDVQVSGLSPGVHGLHIHEKARCEAPTFDSAGSHFNPHQKEHGFLNPKGAHAGDLPNLVVDAQGNGRFSGVTKVVVLDRGKSNSLFKPDGTSLVIHEKADDLKTDPSGNSGKRIACGAVK